MLSAVLAAEEEPNPIVPHPSEMIVGLVAFLLLLWLLWKFALPRFEQAFQARTEAIEGGIKRAEETQTQAQRLLEQYRTQLAEARTEAAQIRESARAEAVRISDEMRAAAQAEQARIVQRGEELLAAQREQVVAQLRAEIGTLAVQLAGRIIGDSLADEASRQRTVDVFLAELDGMAEPVPVGGGDSAPAEAPAAEPPAGEPPAGGAAGTGTSRPRRRRT
ncbi:MAG TPA: F0F1 ATP synthase subunit B [Mycobacteriales bacterium]|nr:F0F1 ATP synthase subunit B [Mycobacteriales bacterium]